MPKYPLIAPPPPLLRESLGDGLRALNAYLVTHGSTKGPFFLGHEPSLAEAATAPAVLRMVAALRALRHIELVGLSISPVSPYTHRQEFPFLFASAACSVRKTGCLTCAGRSRLRGRPLPHL